MTDQSRERVIDYLMKEIEKPEYDRVQKRALNDATSVLINTRSQDQVARMENEKGLRVVK